MTIESFSQFKDLLLLGMGGVIVWLLRNLVTSIQELNVKVAVVIERTDGHEHRISKLEERG